MAHLAPVEPGGAAVQNPPASTGTLHTQEEAAQFLLLKIRPHNQIELTHSREQLICYFEHLQISLKESKSFIWPSTKADFQ